MDTTRPQIARLTLPWLAAGFVLAAAMGFGVLLTQLLMSPATSEIIELAIYFAVAGAVTMLAGWLLLEVAGRVVGLSLQARAFLGSALAACVALVNVLIIAELMFISTEHDLKILLAMIVFSGIVSAYISLRVAGAIAGRVQVLTGAVRSLAAGELRTRVDFGGKDQIAALAQDINSLAQRLADAEAQRQSLDTERRELTIAISHDLRTPLASIRAMVEALDDAVVEGEEVHRYYAAMRREAERLSRMIDDLFELSQIDAGSLRLNKEIVLLDEIAADVVSALQPQADQQEVDLRLLSNGSARGAADGARIERAIANLVRNAIEHTPGGGKVEVAVTVTGSLMEVSVRDNGEGIESADLPHVWDRFYRAAKSRNRNPRNADGAGLGLAIVRGIVEAHGGSVRAESEIGRGSTFTIRLPTGR